ncbi:GNAT family N-acetyltransferase [Cronobacter dublinensis]|uniref:GNAT family N-acetyltransferase n=1 Tax=Cronobacter dublinensis TaxID=413497 RepID=UPI0003A73B39|nr:GNAT family N-acetyltransferase [Cronobacter dublinensis]ALB67699.1 acetyltransferase [Cronobacter dublinensis subsp. dublinensis LMG 23823]MDI7270212.1 GNAT family N-acetyltransferase [Cronobacter dublinensis]
MLIMTRDNSGNPDWQALATLIERAGLGARAPHEVERSYTNSTFCWYGFYEGKLIATAHAISDLTWSSYVADIVVDPDYQGRGFGNQLMDDILEKLLPFGKVFIYAVLDKVSFYKKYQFRELTSGMVCASDEKLFKMYQQGYIR